MGIEYPDAASRIPQTDLRHSADPGIGSQQSPAAVLFGPVGEPEGLAVAQFCPFQPHQNIRVLIFIGMAGAVVSSEARNGIFTGEQFFQIPAHIRHQLLHADEIRFGAPAEFRGDLPALGPAVGTEKGQVAFEVECDHPQGRIHRQSPSETGISTSV